MGKHLRTFWLLRANRRMSKVPPASTRSGARVAPDPNGNRAQRRAARRAGIVAPPQPADERETYYSCCALSEGHDGPCAWKCSDCGGTGRCPECGGIGMYDDVVTCEVCGGDGRCLASCDEGMRGEE